jgi:hypothetical protein
MMRWAIRFALVGKNPCMSWAHGPAHSLCKCRLYVNGRKCDGRIFGRDGWRIVDAGMVAGTCHKLDGEGPYGRLS